MKVGASCRNYLSCQPKSLIPVHYPFSSRHIYRSQASLESLHGVKCFLSDAMQDQPSLSCVGVILEYKNGSRAALGECRVGISKTIRIIEPTMLHLKPTNGQGIYSGAWFTSSKGDAETTNVLRVLGWEARDIGGNVRWWFGLNVIEIVHSYDIEIV